MLSLPPQEGFSCSPRHDDFGDSPRDQIIARLEHGGRFDMDEIVLATADSRFNKDNGTTNCIVQQRQQQQQQQRQQQGQRRRQRQRQRRLAAIAIR